MPSVLLPVPAYKQAGQHTCLPACARMVLQYLGVTRNEEELAKRLDTTPLGTPGHRLTRLQDRQFDVSYGPLTLDLIYDYLNNQIPIIVLVSTQFLDYRQDDFAHAIVVIGYDDDGLWVNDPDLDDNPQRVTPNGLLAAWGEFDFYAGVIVKR